MPRDDFGANQFNKIFIQELAIYLNKLSLSTRIYKLAIFLMNMKKIIYFFYEFQHLQKSHLVENNYSFIY